MWYDVYLYYPQEGNKVPRRAKEMDEKSKVNQQEAEKHQCIFEKRYCEYANKQGNSFKCEAPNDESMTCR